MKVYCISDNVDTQMGLRLAGLEGVVLHDRDLVLECLEKLIKDDMQWIEKNYIENVPPSDVAIDIGYCCG